MNKKKLEHENITFLLVMFRGKGGMAEAIHNWRLYGVLAGLC